MTDTLLSLIGLGIAVVGVLIFGALALWLCVVIGWLVALGLLLYGHLVAAFLVFVV